MWSVFPVTMERDSGWADSGEIPRGKLSLKGSRVTLLSDHIPPLLHDPHFCDDSEYVNVGNIIM
jgi:hypothetical protein